MISIMALLFFASSVIGNPAATMHPGRPGGGRPWEPPFSTGNGPFIDQFRAMPTKRPPWATDKPWIPTFPEFRAIDRKKPPNKWTIKLDGGWKDGWYVGGGVSWTFGGGRKINVNPMSECFEGCLKWFASGMGILLDVPEPENCDCMKEAEKVEKVKE